MLALREVVHYDKGHQRTFQLTCEPALPTTYINVSSILLPIALFDIWVFTDMGIYRYTHITYFSYTRCTCNALSYCIEMKRYNSNPIVN